MNSLALLREADELRLRSLHLRQQPPPFPSADESLALENLLSSAKITDSGDSVGLYDQVTMVSAKDSRDYFRLTLVLPHESNPDEERISVLMPVSLAILGRSVGELASWEANGGIREMRIISLRSSSQNTNAISTAK
jgi:transcription elongation GreA/GreB family factor